MNEQPRATTQSTPQQQVAFVLCGALAHEVLAIAKRHEWNVALFGVAAKHHMQPINIAPAVEERLRELIPQFWRVVVVYGDCGSGGELDRVLEHYNVPRIAGPHCYEMYGGLTFEQLLEEQPGTFFLTDFLVRAFNGTIWKGLGLDRYPELQADYFANYTRLVYLSQEDDPHLAEQAQVIAERLGLPLEIRHTGYGLLETRLVELMAEIDQARYQPKERHDGKLSDPVLVRHSASGARAGRGRASQRSAARTLSGSRRRSRDGDETDRLG